MGAMGGNNINEEKNNVNAATIIPRLRVLKVKYNNSVVNPFFNWSIFNRNQENGIPIENNGGNKGCRKRNSRN